MTPDYVIQHITARGHEDIEPSVTLCRHWFHVLNHAEFNCSLPTPRFAVTHDKDREVCGECITTTEHATLLVNAPYVKERHLFIATVLHEMLHIQQWCDGKIVGHDDEFNILASCYSIKYGIDV
jgi:hypothetical protein